MGVPDPLPFTTVELLAPALLESEPVPPVGELALLGSPLAFGRPLTLMLALALPAVEIEAGSSCVCVMVTPFETMILAVRLGALGESAAVVDEPPPDCGVVGTVGGMTVLGGGGA